MHPRTPVASTFVFSVLAGFAAATPLPLVEMDFNNEMGAFSLQNRGSIAPAAGVLVGGAGQSDDHGPKNRSGKSAALSGSSSYVQLNSLAQLNGLSSFTVTAWVKPSDTKNRYVLSQYDGASGFAVSLDNSNKLILEVDGTSVSSNINVGKNAWSFIGITYNGSATASNVIFYHSTGLDSWSSMVTKTLNRGACDQTISPLLIGSGPIANRTWAGVLDNVRVYGATAGAGGVLTSSELMAAQNFDDVLTPEPATFVVIGVALLVIHFRRTLP